MHFDTSLKTYGNRPPPDPPSTQHKEISICFVVFIFESFPKTEATSDYSRKAFLRAGFEIVAECKYTEFILGDKKVFEGISDHQGVALMVKFLDE